MSMFENKTKLELERGNYIAYADDPGTVVSGSGGGDIVIIEGIAVDSSIEMQASYNDLHAHFSNGKICFLHLADDHFSIYSMMLISVIEHSENYRAGVVWSISGGTPEIAEFEADSATGNLAFSMGG